jgi:16S rRNA (adenine1518-N6/adenine1519-N6)-dimethyltransferase
MNNDKQITSIQFIKKYMETMNMSPLKKWGQNFLIDNTMAEKIISLLEIEPNEHICEIGPGFGALTEQLIKNNVFLDVYEIDPKLTVYLNNKYGDIENINIYNQDILKVDLKKYDRIVSNLPYYLTTDIINQIIKQTGRIKTAVLTIQKEVFTRLTAKPGRKEYGPLAIMIEYVGNCQKMFDIKPASFYPVPPVDSIVIKIDFKTEIDTEEVQKLHILTNQLFKKRRKTILNNLMRFLNDKNKANQLLKELNTNSLMRPEQLSLDFYVKLMNNL